MVGEDWSCEKDLKLVGREFHRQGEELCKEQSEDLSFEVRGGKERQRSEKRILPVGLTLMSNGNDFELFALFYF